MEDRSPPLRRLSGNRRSKESDQAIMDAAHKLLRERGYEGLNFDSLAREAGVSRPTVYRRWASKSELLEDIAYGTREADPIVLAGSDLRLSIRQFLEAIAAFYSRPEIRSAVLGVMASMPSTDQYPCKSSQDAEISMRGAMQSFVDEAKCAGLMRDDVESNAFYDLAVGSILYRHAFSYRRSMKESLDGIVDLLMRAVARD